MIILMSFPEMFVESSTLKVCLFMKIRFYLKQRKLSQRQYILSKIRDQRNSLDFSKAWQTFISFKENYITLHMNKTFIYNFLFSELIITRHMFFTSWLPSFGWPVYQGLHWMSSRFISFKTGFQGPRSPQSCVSICLPGSSSSPTSQVYLWRSTRA